jgi:hypothetical protein
LLGQKHALLLLLLHLLNKKNMKDLIKERLTCKFDFSLFIFV